MPRLSKTSSPLTALLLTGLTFLFLQCLPLATASALPVLHIGGFFSIFNEQGVVDVAQLEHASVFLQAVDEINNNPDILPNHELQVVMGNSATTLEAAVATKQMLQMNSFVGAVNALDNIKGGYLTQLFDESDSMIVNSMTSDSSFGDGRFPFMVQTIPVKSHQGKAYQFIECLLNLTRITIFTTDDVNGGRFADQFSDGSYCQIDLLGKYSFPSHTTDFTDILLDAMKMEGRTFLMYIESPTTIRHILEQGYEIGLFRDGTQILLDEVHGFDEAFYDLPDKEVEAITKGVVTLEYAPDYSVYTTTRGLKFYNSWLNQTTLGNCSTTVDAAGNKYLLHSSGSCASLNFTSYELKDSSLNSYAVLSYDAAYTLAWGLHYAIQDGLLLTGRNLSQTIIDKVNFVGASGLVDISAGDSRLNGRGDRNLGVYYKFLNFHIDDYQLGQGQGLVPFFMLAEGATRPCPASLYKCRPPVLVKDSHWTSGYPPYAFATAPEIVKIGGLFSAFVNGGSTLDKENAEFLAMFLMAVSEINNKTDGINDNLLPNTQLKVSVVNSVSTELSGATAYADLKDSFYRSGVSGLINTLSSELVKSINSYALHDKTFQVLSKAEDADLAEGLQYAYKSSTIPLDSFIGTVFQDFLCSNDLEKIAILAEDNSFGLHSTIDLTTPHDKGCHLKVLYQVAFPSTTTDFTSIVSEVKKSGAQIIVVFAGPSTTATLLMQGTNQGVFVGDMLYLTSEFDSLTEELESTHNLNTKQVIEVMRGVVSASFFPEYGLKHTEMGESFVNRFLKFGADRVSSYVKKCKQFDDSAKRYMLRNTATGVGCAELNYTKYITGEMELGPYAAMAYDATYALAWAIHDVLLNSKPLTSDNIRDSMYDSVNFEGVSGEIDVLRGTSIRTGYNQGNRVSGVHYRLMNFNEFVYSSGDSLSFSVANPSPNPNAMNNNNNNNNSGFVMVGLWSVEHRVEECPDGLSCYEMVYANKPSTKIPNDSRSPIIHDFTESFRLFLYVLGGVTIFVSLMFFVLTICFRKTPEVQNSQEYMLYFILLGGLLAGVRVINSALPLSDQSCLVGYWLSNLSLWLAMMAFFLKSWRVNRLLAIKSIKRVKITTSQVLFYMLLSILFMVGMLTLLTKVGEPRYDEVVSVSSNRETIVPFCDMVHYEIQTTLYAIHALLIGTGLKICWSLRDVPKKFSDFHTIGSATIVIAALCVFVMPIVYLLGLRRDMSSAAATTAFGVGGIIVMVIVFGDKFLPFFKCTRSSSQILDESHSSTAMIVQIFSQDVVRQMKPDDQFEYYTKIIQKYTALRLQLNSGESTNSQVETRSKYDEENPSKNGRPSSMNDSKVLNTQLPTI